MRQGKSLPERALQCAGQPIRGLVSRGREVLIHNLLRLCPALDSKRLAQDGNIGNVFLTPACHELAGQEIAEISRSVEMQLAVGFQQALRRKLMLTQPAYWH